MAQQRVVMLDQPIKHWYCPNCPVTKVTREARPHMGMHVCPGLRGILAPLLEVGVKAKVEARDREDYLGKDIPQTDENGRPVMSVVTTRDDGQDTMVLAPAATIVSD